MTKLYPLTLKLNDKNVLVVGGGRVALRKLQGLVGTGAHITVIAPDILPEITELTGVNIIQRPFESTDTQNAHIIYAATDDPEVNDEVASYVQSWQWFDDTAFPDASNFFTPAVARVDGLIVSVSTEARDPVRAKLVKEKIADFLLNASEE